MSLTTFTKYLAPHYTNLYPRELIEQKGRSLSEVWGIFSQLAIEWLYPLAKLDIILCDLPCGYDWAANIMVNLEDDDAVSG